MSTRSDRGGGAAWIAFGLAILAGAWQMDRYQSMGGTLFTAPGLVPGIYGALLIVLGAALALRRGSEPASEASSALPLLNRRVVWVLVLSLVYAAVLIGRVHFGACTAAYVALFCWLFDDQSPPKKRVSRALAIGILSALTIVLVFEKVFLVRLP